MTEPSETAEPSGASGGSGVCPYVTGTVTRYCTLTPFTLTDAEREAIAVAAEAYEQNNGDPDCERIADTLHGLLDRLGGT